MKILQFALILASTLFVLPTFAETSYRVYDKEYKTYPFFDPNPIPRATRFYPYFRFDGFSIRPEQKKWKVVELSNDYVSLDILPEIGGKIWTVTEKKTGKSIIYSNPVIKFRDVGMRGPWTSGGIEVNVGIIGHTPNCSSPVDYDVRKNADGSVSCFIGALDLIARAVWQVEINLPEKSSAFSMRFFWHNGSGQTQPYYTWTNIGVRSESNMQAVNPGTNYIGHGGEIADWPNRSEDGRDLSVYTNNDFGSYKSYHILGKLTESYGVYYPAEDFGVASYIPSEGKRGRKIWIWGLSREGMIWEDLLTDPPGKQYVEIQAGRLFNQCRGESSYTPFKSREFAPYSTDRWLEYWLPVMKIGGFKTAGPFGAMNVEHNGTDLKVSVSPARSFSAPLTVFDGKKEIWRSKEPLVFETSNPTIQRVTLPYAPKDLNVVLGNSLLVWPGDSEKPLSRSWISTIDQKKIESPSADYNFAREMMRDRQFGEADLFYKKCLKKDPLFAAAYTGLAENANRRGDYSKAAEFARQALAIDIYDASANFQFGTASTALGNFADAVEAFSIAALPNECRSAAFTGLAKVRLAQKLYQRAKEAAQQALDSNVNNVDALTARLAAIRYDGSTEEKDRAVRIAKEFLAANPLLLAIRAELFLANKISLNNLLDAVRCELPHESFLELAVWYRNSGLTSDAVRILNVALNKQGIRKTEILYYLAFLTNDPAKLKRAEQESPDFCFPFRAESLDVFRWALKNGSSWKNRYYLAALLNFLEKKNEARDLLKQCGDQPNYPPFYILRAQLTDQKELAGRDYKKAFELDRQSARYTVLYAQFLNDNGKIDDLEKLTGETIKKFPTNTRLVLLRATALLQSGQSKAALSYLENAVFLPAEGSLLGRNIYYRAALQIAARQYSAGQYRQALSFCDKARLWPENLGSGKPYPNGCDERLEDWIAFLCLRKLGQKEQAEKLLLRILTPIDSVQKKKFEKNPANELLTALALYANGKGQLAENIRNKMNTPKSKHFAKIYDLFVLSEKQDTNNNKSNKKKEFDIQHLIQEIMP